MKPWADMEIGRIVAQILTEHAVGSAVDEAGMKALQLLNSDQAKLAGTIPLNLELFGCKLPSELRSCRLSVLRGGAAYHVERHPNATQYVYSIANCGSISVLEGDHWTTTQLTDGAQDAICARWHVVPANHWHQPVPGHAHWTVLGFHSIAAEELIDDYAFNGPART